MCVSSLSLSGCVFTVANSLNFGFSIALHWFLSTSFYLCLFLREEGYTKELERSLSVRVSVRVSDSCLSDRLCIPPPVCLNQKANPLTCRKYSRIPQSLFLFRCLSSLTCPTDNDASRPIGCTYRTKPPSLPPPFLSSFWPLSLLASFHPFIPLSLRLSISVHLREDFNGILKNGH